MFDHLSACHGRHFADMWAHSNPDTLKAVWSEKLGGFHDHPEAIKFALDRAAELKFPPTLGEFLELCRAAPRKEEPKPLALERKFTPEEIAANKKRLADMLAGLNATKRMPSE